MKVMSILAPYSPPLGSSQVDAIAKEIAKVSADELKAAEKMKAPKRFRKKS
jgi:hypothetical protein